MQCLTLLIQEIKSICCVSKKTGIARQTLKRWMNSFENSSLEAKRIFVFKRYGQHQSHNVLPLLLHDPQEAMVSLYDSFNAPLY